MRHYLFAPLTFVFYAALAAIALGQTPSPEDLLLALQRAQDKLARGDLSALSEQKELHIQLQMAFSDPLKNDGYEHSQSTAIIGYALNGAQPSLAQRLLTKIDTTDRNYALSKAVSELLTGNKVEAAARFDEIPLSSIDLKLAPYVVLAHATAQLDFAVDKSVAGYKLAIVLGTGTLVEEVALRRLVSASTKTQDGVLFSTSSNLYLRRYANSPFSGQFFDTFVKNAPRLMPDDDLIGLLSIVGLRRKDSALPLHLTVAQGASELGKTKLVKALLNLSENSVAPLNSENAEKIKLYKLIVAISEPELPIKSLESYEFKPDKLSEEENIILSKLSSVLVEVFEPLTMFESEGEKVAKSLLGSQNANVQHVNETSPAQAEQDVEGEDKELSLKIEAMSETVKASIDLTSKLLQE